MAAPLRFALPPSVAKASGVDKLAAFLSAATSRATRVVVAKSYRDLTQQAQMGSVDLAWAPPFVAARLESAGLRVILRGIRKGASTYRAALLAANPDATLGWLKGRKAVWVDPYSVSGCLLPLVFLRSQGFDPDRDFRAQEFAGSYLKAIERVLAGKGDVTSIYAPAPGVQWMGETGLAELAPDLVPKLKVIAFTDVVPNSGLVASPGVAAEAVKTVREALKALKAAQDGPYLLEQIFQMDGFEDSTSTSAYHALYRLAVASI